MNIHGVQVMIPVLSNDHFASQSVSDWDLVHFFQAVADMGSVDYARHTGTFLTQGSRNVPKDPSEGMKYFLQAAEAGLPLCLAMRYYHHTRSLPSPPLGSLHIALVDSGQGSGRTVLCR